MPEAVAQLVVAAAGIHLALGLVFAAAFHCRGIGRVDPAAARSTIAFRVLATPGIAALWPVLARAWWRARRAEPRA